MEIMKKHLTLILQRNKLLYCFLIIAILSSCQKSKEITDNWKKFMGNDLFLKFIDNEDVAFYDGTFVSQNYLTGVLYEKENKILFKSNQDTLEFVLFDFNLKKDECIDVKYFKKDHYKKYNLCNKDIFYDEKISDTVYKFYFKNYDFFNKGTDLMVFVSKKKGILGNYFLDATESEENPLVYEKMYGNVYQERYDYSKYRKIAVE